jgi:hypothetical protein
MSNRRKLPRQVPPAVAEMARTARCSDCPAHGQARRTRDGGWEIKLWHAPSCPAYAQTTAALHADAKASVARAAGRTGAELAYEALSDAQGVVTGSGLVTAGPG